MAKVRSLAILPGGYEFKIAAGRDFHRTVDALKAKVPKDMRDFDPDRCVWMVNRKYEDVLRQIFTNFESAVAELNRRVSCYRCWEWKKVGSNCTGRYCEVRS